MAYPWTADSQSPTLGGVDASSGIYTADGGIVLDNGVTTPSKGTLIPGIAKVVFNQPCTVQGSTLYP